VEQAHCEKPELESERIFRYAFAHASIGVAVVDTSGTYVFTNEAFCRISGYEDHELRNMKFVATLHPEDRASRMEVFRQVLAGELASYTRERRFIRKDGNVVWVRMSITVSGENPHPTQVLAFIEEITERKHAESALLASEERFRIAAENASDLIYEWDLRTGQVTVFGRSQQLLGDWPMPVSFDAWKDIVHPQDLERNVPELARFIASGESYSGEFRVIGRNGRIYYYSNRGQAIRNATGEPYKWIGLCTDITESKLAEAAESQLAAIVQCSESAIIATDLNGVITTWNQAAQKLLGYTSLREQTMSVGALLPSVDLARDILAQIQHGQSSRLDEVILLHRDGSQIPALVSISPIRQSNGYLTGAAIIASDIRARKQTEKEMAHRAMHDHLTGLPNGLLLADQLAASIATSARNGCGTAVIFVDLDGFKFVNDTLGHDAGDVLLQQVAVRLSGCIRRGDVLARMGGDEFIAVVNAVTEDQVGLKVAERLSASLRDSFFVDHHELFITASMGISIYPKDGPDVSTLRRNADAAMYEAKQSGKDRIRFFTPALGQACQARLELETDLRRALDRQELRVHYQPIFTAATNRQTAYEALARWPHPKLGFVPPSQFIPVAEETGLIIRLGEWVLREACSQCHWWQEHGQPSVRVAVNVSALQFARADFVDTVLGVLWDSRLDGTLLELELTESILMQDMENAIEKMTRLHENGVRISVDDFGTGYSSLGYLPNLPIDTLKLDRCFVTHIADSEKAVALIHGMISLAHGIGKRVIVEGVETSAQLEILRNLGCEEVQGYLLGRPASLEHYAEQSQHQLTA
jgi:diguanylate cyclase (GGDEF)-like protein/PAS domain S-box-containing protein